jgi:hypothetical protein
MTEPLTIDVLGQETDVEVRLEWAGPDGMSPPLKAARLGEVTEVVLRIRDLDADTLYSKSSALVPIVVPENAIVEALPVSEIERTSGIVLRLSVIPLGGQSVPIAARNAGRGGLQAKIPALLLEVQPSINGAAETADASGSSRKTDTPPPADTVSSDTDAYADNLQVKPVSFDTLVSREPVFPPFAPAYKDCLETAASLWNGERYAEALAILRSGERSLCAAAAMKRARIVCEGALNLPSAPSEPWLPLVPLAAVFVLCVLSVAAVLLRRRRQWRVPVLLTAALFMTAISALSAILFFFAVAGDRAVTKRTAAYPIPEADAVPAVFFMEGEPVRVRTRSGIWLYVESGSNHVPRKSGWLKTEDAALY